MSPEWNNYGARVKLWIWDGNACGSTLMGSIKTRVLANLQK